MTIPIINPDNLIHYIHQNVRKLFCVFSKKKYRFMYMPEVDQTFSTGAL